MIYLLVPYWSVDLVFWATYRLQKQWSKARYVMDISLGRRKLPNSPGRIRSHWPGYRYGNSWGPAMIGLSGSRFELDLESHHKGLWWIHLHRDIIWNAIPNLMANSKPRVLVGPIPKCRQIFLPIFCTPLSLDCHWRKLAEQLQIRKSHILLSLQFSDRPIKNIKT